MLNEISYKPFVSFFNVTQAAASQPLLAGIGMSSSPASPGNYQSLTLTPLVDYASAVAIELHSNPTSEPTVNVRFKNGTTDPTFHDVNIFNQTTLPLSQFISNLAVRCFQSASPFRALTSCSLQPIAVNTTQQWCTACNQTSLRGCSVFQH